MVVGDDSFVYQEQDGEIDFDEKGHAEHYGPFGQPGFKQAAEVLASRLPTEYLKDPESNNYLFQGPIAEELQGAGTDIVDADRANTVQLAFTIPQLQRLAKLVDVYHREGEDIETFRARIIYHFQLVTCRGTIEDLLRLAATILDIDSESLEYIEQEIVENGVAQLTIPPEALDSLPLTIAELADILEGAVPAGYRLDILSDGRFVYINETEHANQDYDPENGYAGLDANGNPTRTYNGYAGLL